MEPDEGTRSLEFDLVLACVRWPQETVDSARIRELARHGIRWPHFLEIVQHHQVASLVSRNLTSAGEAVPQESLTNLRRLAIENAHICFQGISELVRLIRLFDQRGVAFRVLKGAPLAIEAFGDATLRGSGDIDLLIGEKDIPNADTILRSEGYLPMEPEAWHSPRRMRSYIEHQKDFTYENRQNGIVLDLHWRLFRNRWLPSNAAMDEAGLAWVQLGTERIPALPVEQLFLYLCVHGALDGWLRLKWLADIGALLRRFSPQQIHMITQAAAAQQILPEVSAAILLCQQKLGFDRAPAECLSPQEPSVARILRFAERLMASNQHCPVRERISSGSWFRNEFSLHSTSRYRAALIRRSLFRPRLWRQISLPDRLFPLYALLSPFEWVVFRLQRLTARLLHSSRRQQLPSSSTPRRVVLGRFFKLAPADLGLLAEAMVLLAFFRVALRLFPVQRLTARMGTADSTLTAPQEERALRTLRRIEWAIGAVVRHGPFTFVCFPQSLAAYFMLRRRHIHSQLFYGVAREEKQLKAHTWIKVGDRTVVGGETESLFTVLAIFP